jgi:hypothetical protein
LTDIIHATLLNKTRFIFKCGFKGIFDLRRFCTGTISDSISDLLTAVIVGCLVLVSGTAYSAETDQHLVWQNAELTIVFDPGIESFASETNRLYPSVKRELEEGFGWLLGVRPTVVLIRTREKFQRIVPGPLFVAVAVPSQNTIVIDTSRVQTAPHTLRITLAHEMAHLMLHHHIGSGRLPRWLDEGVCQWFTGGVAEIMINRYRPMLGKALGSGEYIPLADLTHRFPSDPRQLMLAYEQSRDIVTLIANRYGPEHIFGILDSLRAGHSVETSFQSQLGISVTELEKIWRRQLSDSAIWWGRLASHLYSILFFLAAVLTVTGFVVRRIRRKSLMEEEDDEDGIG